MTTQSLSTSVVYFHILSLPFARLILVDEAFSENRLLNSSLAAV
jgi:hypothetical protein